MAGKLGEVFVEILGDASPFAEDFGSSLDQAGQLATDELTEAMAEAAEAAGGELTSGIEGAVDDLAVDPSGAFDPLSDEAAGAAGDAADALEGGLAGLDLDVDAGGAFDGIAEEADAAAADAADAFSGFGDTIASEVEDGVDDASGALSGLTDSLGSVQGALGTAAGGAGLEAFARGAGDSTAALRRMEGRLGESESDIRSMIDATTDWTFSSNDAAAGMELLSQRGVDNLDTMGPLLGTWDDFADATGGDFLSSMDDGQRALGAFNIPAEEAGDHIDTLTFMANEVNVPMDRLARQVRGNEEELDALGIGLDETAGLLGAMGAQGMDGRDAVALLGRELGNADGDLDTLVDSLGLTNDEFEEYVGKVGEAEGITGEQADIANSTATPMERLAGVTENLAFRFGAFGETAGMLSAPLGAIGPALFTVNQASGGLAKVMPALGTGLRAVGGAFRALGVAIMANPIFLIAAIIIGIVAVIWYFRDEIMEALGAAWDWIRDVFGSLGEWFSDVWSRITDAVPEAFGAVLDWFRELPGRILDALSALASTVVDFVTEYHPLAILWRLVSDNWTEISGWFTGLPGRIVDTLGGLATTVVDFIREWHPLAVAWRLVQEFAPQVIAGIVSFVTSVADTIAGWVDDIVGFVTGLWDRWIAINEAIGEAVREWIAGLAASVVATVMGWVDDLVGFVTGLRDRWSDLVESIRETVIEAIAGLVASVVSTVTGWVSDMIGFATGLHEDFVDIVASLINDAVDWFAGLPGRIMEHVRGFGTLLRDAGRDLIRGLINGITGMAQNAVDAVTDVGSNIVSGVKGVFGIGSPSRVFAEEVGGPLMEGVAVGVERMAPSALDEIEQFANEATSRGEMGAIFNEEDLRPVGPESRGSIRPAEVEARSGREPAGVGAAQQVEVNIYTADPVKAGRQTVKELRDAAYLHTPFEPARRDTDTSGGDRVR